MAGTLFLRSRRNSFRMGSNGFLQYVQRRTADHVLEILQVILVFLTQCGLTLFLSTGAALFFYVPWRLLRALAAFTISRYDDIFGVVIDFQTGSRSGRQDVDERDSTRLTFSAAIFQTVIALWEAGC